MTKINQVFSLLTLIAVIGATHSAFAGPCTAQIAQVEQRINEAGIYPEIEPSAPQTVGAQLGRQPTPQTVRDAEMNANELAQAALNRVKKADAAGNAAACTQALIALKEWYGVE